MSQHSHKSAVAKKHNAHEKEAKKHHIAKKHSKKHQKQVKVEETEEWKSVYLCNKRGEMSIITVGNKIEKSI